MQPNAMLYHLRYNMYPPIEDQHLDKAIALAWQAIEEVACGSDYTPIQFPAGVTIPAYQVVDDLRLDGFVDAMLAEIEGES